MSSGVKEGNTFCGRHVYREILYNLGVTGEENGGELIRVSRYYYIVFFVTELVRGMEKKTSKKEKIV